MTLESHINYLREVVVNDPLRFTFQLLDYDSKRQHFFGCMYQAKEGYLAATHEWLTIHVDLKARRSAAMPEDKVAMLETMMADHAHLPRPDQAGRNIGIRRK
jgi:acyl-CoA thioester hydrolase